MANDSAAVSSFELRLLCVSITLGLAGGPRSIDDRGNLVRGDPRGTEAVFGDGGVTSCRREILVAEDVIPEIVSRGGTDDVPHCLQPAAAFEQSAPLHLSGNEHA